MNSHPQEYDFERLLKAAVLKILQETTTTSSSVNMDTDLNPSNLGTREYWEETYLTDLQNYEDTNGIDVGEIWFGFESERRIVNWITRKGYPKTTSVIDIGCGNGSLLLALHKNGFTNLTGIDYSQAAVSLATTVARDKNANTIQYSVADITVPEDCREEHPQLFARSFDLCIDKGTYDAICLNPLNSREKRALYAKNLHKILNENGVLVITSCNWTKDEMVSQFTDFEVVDELPAPQFQFGGKSGRTVTALVFKRR
ncbi:EEF1A lysine methyltransferase 2-like [Paramacrobiotus metropolitanus]|uniref:EEF1A lysine methyltransferase 2-like n=1 Tax=Paramacrobiotus metropolitanus TaxID=2943436 RepID=UPI0024464F40|nr:EEF1A lysine methyltransferase 2-like [Paramacrobiotus metropolitanus]XP_055338158.1 EEF1A lysine methyltransferase 2-like [Paramacrobiotus metropolitanus]